MQSHEVFSYQGKVALGIRNPDGTRTGARWVGNASVCELDLSEDKDTQKESFLGQRGLYATLPTGKTLQVKVTMQEISDDNAALGLGGTKVDVVTGTVTAEPLPAGTVGDMVALDYAKVSDVVITPSGGGSELVQDTDYSLNANTGVLTYLTAQATGPSAAYSYAAHSIVTALSGSRPEFYVLFDGVNTVDGTGSHMRGEVYRVSFPPASSLGLISESFGTFELTGDALVDVTRQTDPRFGAYARVILVDPDEE